VKGVQTKATMKDILSAIRDSRERDYSQESG